MMSLFFILLWHKVIYLSMFYDCHYYLYLFICNYLCIYTPSYQHFKAFPLSKFNSETSFLYQLFKEDSNFRVKKPCKVIYLSAYDVFLKPCKIIYLSIFFTIHLFFMNTRGLRLLHCTLMPPKITSSASRRCSIGASYALHRLPKIISFNPPLVRLHSFLVRKVLLLPVTTFQDYYHFKPCLNILNIVKIMISRLKSIRYVFILTTKI